MYKYLYGKRKYLQDWIDGRQGIRLSDIAYYSVMKNKKMRDDELAKDFVHDKNKVFFSVNGVAINPNNMTTNPVSTLRPDRCFCVCLSGKKNDPELFKRFKADICIEVDVLKLVEEVKKALSILDGVDVIHREVNYYPPVMASPMPDLISALFYKRDIYEIESEYRVAVTIPPHRRYFQDVDGGRFAIFSDDPNDIRHMFINGATPEINQGYIVSVCAKPNRSKYVLVRPVRSVKSY